LKDGFKDRHHTEATLRHYKALGITYTRVWVGLSAFLDDNNPSVLKADSLAALDALIQMHVKTGIGIMLCTTGTPSELYTDPIVQAKLMAFFKAFATHLSRTDPEIVFLEVMNEPNAATPQVWNNVLVQLISALRSGAPNHTIIADANVSVTANDWNNVGALPMTQILKDKNVVYNFHCYDPFVFTHQGATWALPFLQFIKNVPYPSTSLAVAPILNAIQDAEAKSAVKNYGKENWNRDKFVSYLAPIANWAKTNEVAVICNEFGATWWVAPRDSWLRYLKDFREVLESYGIGWAEYFEFNVRDNEAMQALGLKPLPHP
jgi:endoglucanase